MYLPTLSFVKYFNIYPSAGCEIVILVLIYTSLIISEVSAFEYVYWRVEFFFFANFLFIPA